MRKLIITTVLFVTAFTIAQAQPGQGRGFNGTPEERAERQTADLKEKLTLSEAQAAKVKAVNLKYAEKMEAMRQDTTSGREAMRAKMQTLRAEKQAEIKPFLTAEQFAQYEKMEAERGEGRGRKDKGGQGKGEKQKEGGEGRN